MRTYSDIHSSITPCYQKQTTDNSLWSRAVIYRHIRCSHHRKLDQDDLADKALTNSIHRCTHLRKYTCLLDHWPIYSIFRLKDCPAWFKFKIGILWIKNREQTTFVAAALDVTAIFPTVHVLSVQGFMFLLYLFLLCSSQRLISKKPCSPFWTLYCTLSLA